MRTTSCFWWESWKGSGKDSKGLCPGPARRYCTASHRTLRTPLPPDAMSAALVPVAGDRMEADEAAAPSACGSPKRGRPGEFCGNAPGANTNHPGAGRCWLHGGNSLVRHGRYSLIKSERLRGLLEGLREMDKDPLDLVPDVEMLRVLFMDYLNRYDEYTRALLAWYESYEARRLPPSDRMLSSLRHVATEYLEMVLADSTAQTYTKEAAEDVAKLAAELAQPDTGRPRVIMDIADAKGILDSAGRMVERIEKIRSANAISRPELNRIYQEMWRAVDALVEDDAAKADIRKAWLNIAL